MRLRGRVTIGGAGLAAIAVVVLLTSGCGYGPVASASGKSDPDNNGKTLFSQKCGSCHTLQAAATTGTIGPNLDNAFAGSRIQGYSSSTIANVVLDQIRVGSVTPPITSYRTEKKFTSKKCLDPATKASCYATAMPANIVTGQDAIDVATYVASVAGTGPGGYTTPVDFAALGNDGKAIVQAACGSCHTLGDAGIKGQAPGAPNLDTLKPSFAAVLRQVTVGGGIMPAFAGKLTAAQIRAVAQYVSSVAGKK